MSHFINRLLFKTLALGAMAASLGSCKSRSGTDASDVKNVHGDRIGRYTYDYPAGVDLQDTIDFYESGTMVLFRCQIIEGNVIGTCKDTKIPNAVTGAALQNAVAAANEAKTVLKEMQVLETFLDKAVTISDGIPCASAASYSYLSLDMVGTYSSNVSSYAMTSKQCDQIVNPGLVANGKKSPLGVRVESYILSAIQKVHRSLIKQ
jgi:hypothetical protein